jgi:hypothetical protein
VPEDYYRVLKENKQIQENLKAKKGTAAYMAGKSKITNGEFESM